MNLTTFKCQKICNQNDSCIQISISNLDWIDPDDMGLSTGTLVKSPKKTETTTSMPNQIELNKLQEEIRILKRNISLMLEENIKLNKTNLILRNKIITISTNLSHQNISKVQNDVINIPGDSDEGKYLILIDWHLHRRIINMIL